MKKKLYDIVIIIVALILIWIIASTIQVNCHNLNDQMYSKWNFWKLCFDYDDIEDTSHEIRIIKEVNHESNK